MKRIVLIGVALLLAGCMPSRSHEPERFFVLYPAAAPARYAGPAVVVAPTSAGAFYGSVQIVYSDNPGTRSRYRYSFWTEPPQAVIHAQLASRLEGAGGVPRVLLGTHVQEIYHDAAAAPGLVRVTLGARLESLPGRGLLAQRSFSRTAPVLAYSAAGAVEAMRMALGAVLDDIVAWVQAQGAQVAATPDAGAVQGARMPGTVNQLRPAAVEQVEEGR
jgi:ABC-type uncharacterized transport system auxiliary subunit